MLHSYDDAAEAAKIAFKLIKSPKCSEQQSLKGEVETMYLEALSRSCESSHWEKTIELYEKVNSY